MEIWKDIPGYEGLYQASSYGEIRSIDGKVTSSSRYRVRRWKGRIMKGRGDEYSTGRRVCLWKDGKKKDFLVARLVAITFLGDPPEGFTVNHKDGNRLNNRIENLEWLSREDNIRHAFDTGLMTFQNEVEIKNDSESIRFRSMAEASRYLGRNNGYISLCIKNGRQAIGKDGVRYEIIPERKDGKHEQN